MKSWPCPPYPSLEKYTKFPSEIWSGFSFFGRQGYRVGGNWIKGLVHAKHMLFHWATTQPWEGSWRMNRIWVMLGKDNWRRWQTNLRPQRRKEQDYKVDIQGRKKNEKRPMGEEKEQETSSTLSSVQHKGWLGIRSRLLAPAYNLCL